MTLPPLPALPPVLDSDAFPVPFTPPDAYGTGLTAPDAATGVQVTGIVQHASEGPLVYEPVAEDTRSRAPIWLMARGSRPRKAVMT